MPSFLPETTVHGLSVEGARSILDEMAGRVRELLEEMRGALAAADDDA